MSGTICTPEPDDGVVQIPGFGLRGFALRQDGSFAIGGDFQGTIDLGDGPETYSSRGFYAVYQP